MSSTSNASGKKCPRCGRVYASSYQSCPYCARRGRHRREPEGPIQQVVVFLREYGDRIFLFCTAFFLVIAIVGMMISGFSSPNTTPKPTPGNSNNTPEQEDPLPTAEPLALSTNLINLTVGETAALTPTGGGEDAAVWTTSDPAVATVENGVVTAHGAGSATITITVGTEQAMCVASVKEKDPDVEVVLNSRDFTIGPNGAPVQMHVYEKGSRRDYNGSVVWAIEDTSVATVTEDGLVERVSRGTTKLTATMGSKVLECIVRIS